MVVAVWLLALAAPLTVFLTALTCLRRQRRRPLALAAPLALALTICFEAALLNPLSAFHAVGRGLLLAAHGAVVLFAAGALWRAPPGLCFRLASWRGRAPQALVPAALVLLLSLPVAYSALFYLPNNWDSMTYHLARVAQWMQHGSVNAFETNVVRQVTYPPGAEYLLLVLQTIGGTDRLANLVQLTSWLIVAIAAPSLARLFGAPREIAPWAAFLFTAAPMAVLQASSTQNDLVASAVATAAVVACLPFLHEATRWRASDLVVAAAAVSAGLLVKPTALVITAPFILWAAIRGACGFTRVATGRRTRARGIVPALLLVAVLLAPEVARRADVSEQGEFSPFLYSPFSFERDRAVNVLRGIARHVPLPEPWTAALASAATGGCTRPWSMCAQVASRAHEDYAGNPASVLLVAVLVLAGAARWRLLPTRAKVVLVALAGAWVLFGLVFRDNVWIARLHLPIFGLLPLAAGAFSRLDSGRRWLRCAAPIAGIVLWSFGLRAAYCNETRPVPNTVATSLGLLPASYYAARPEEWPSHVRAMVAITDSGCKRLGLLIGGDSYDYPFTWRAMQRGIAVRHMLGPDDWPCVVYSERGSPPALAGGGWCRTLADPQVFVRRAPGTLCTVEAKAQ
jgi:hypothetical protein